MTITTQAAVAAPASGLSIAPIICYAIVGPAQTILVGDLVPIPASSLLSGSLTAGLATASAAQRKSSVAGIALEGGTAGVRIRVLIQGRGKCLMKSTGNNAIAVGDPLCFGTARALEADPPTVNTNRWVGYADEAFAAGSSSTAALKDVILLGPHGLGMQASGT